MRNYCCHLLPLHAAGLFLGHNHRAWISRCVGSPVFVRSLLSWIVIDKCQLYVSSSRGYSWWVLTYRLSYLCFGGFSDYLASLLSAVAGVTVNHSYSNLRARFKPFQWFHCVYMTCQVWFNVFSEPIRDTNLLIVTLKYKDFLTWSAPQSTGISGWVLLLRVSPNFCFCVILLADTFWYAFQFQKPNSTLCFV